MPCRVILLIVLLGLGAAAAQEPTADGDTNGDGVVDAAEERAQQQLHDSLVQAAALMEHGSATAKEAATEEIARMAIITTIDQPFHPVTYRNAAIKAGIVELLVALLSPTADATAAAQRNALAALEAIATDDPTTDLDNDHARYVCDAGAVQHVVRLLSSPQEQLQVQSAACAAILAESVPCQTALSAAKAEVPLVQLGTFGNDVAKLHALAALEQMALNNPLARERIAKGGGLEMLHGVGGFGSGSDLRDAAADFARGLEASDETVQVAVDIRSHARRAHETRLKHSKIFQNHVGVARSYATPSPRGVPGDSRAECIKWAQEGECERNPGFMLENCARSCAGQG